MSTSVPSVSPVVKEPSSLSAAEPTASTGLPDAASTAPAPAEPALPPPAQDRPRPLATFLVFLLLGPPIGGLLFVLAVYVSDRLSRPGAVSSLDALDIVRTVAITVPFSFVFGGLQALAVAIHLALRRAHGKPISTRRALGAALFVSVLFAPLLFLIRNNPAGVGAGPAPLDTWLFVSASLGALSLAATFLCALILRLKW